MYIKDVIVRHRWRVLRLKLSPMSKSMYAFSLRQARKGNLTAKAYMKGEARPHWLTTK